jgi:hypothetical protein
MLRAICGVFIQIYDFKVLEQLYEKWAAVSSKAPCGFAAVYLLTFQLFYKCRCICGWIVRNNEPAPMESGAALSWWHTCRFGLFRDIIGNDAAVTSMVLFEAARSCALRHTRLGLSLFCAAFASCCQSSVQ